jgi:transcriptional regulator with XRE-family HTH domain
MAKRILSPLAAQREKLGLTQDQMSAVLKTVQSEISKTELGELPPVPDRKRWARAYRLTPRKFVRLCEAAQWALPLWKFFVRTPSQVEFLETVKALNAEGRSA